MMYAVGDIVKRKDGFWWGCDGEVIERRPDRDGEQRFTVRWHTPANIGNVGDAWEIGSNLALVTAAPRPEVWHGSW